MKSKVFLSGKIEARFGWDAFPKQYSGGLISGLRYSTTDVDCDAGALLCGDNGKPISSNPNECFLNYVVSNMFDSAILHHGDNQTGLKSDDEIITIDLLRIPESIKIIILTLDLFKEKKKNGNGKIHNTFVRIVNTESGGEVARNDFNHLGFGKKLVVVGKIIRIDSNQWFFDQAEESYSVKSIEEFIKMLC